MPATINTAERVLMDRIGGGESDFVPQNIVMEVCLRRFLRFYFARFNIAYNDKDSDNHNYQFVKRATRAARYHALSYLVLSYLVLSYLVP